jgi:hypothetical protein
MRAVELAVYADVLAGEAASLAARADRARSRLHQAAIERRARAELSETTIERLEGLGLLGATDERAARTELRELELVLDRARGAPGVGRGAAGGGYGRNYRGVSPTSSPPSSS